MPACIPDLGDVAIAGRAGSSPSSSPTITETTTVTPSPSSGHSGSATPSPSTQAGGQPCLTSSLTGTLAPAPGGGAAGSVYYLISLANTSSVSCTLQGWPGVSFVGDGNGTQLGAAAVLNRDSAHTTVTIPVGGTATAQLQVTQAGNEPASCNPQTADGLRVYPPGEKAALFIQSGGLTACTDASIQLLHVDAFVAG